MAQIVVLALPGDRAQSAALAEALGAAGFEATAPDVSGIWDDARWRSVTSSWPAAAFVIFCVTARASKDGVLSRILWGVVPMKEDPTGRFIFAVFDKAASESENIGPFARRHASFAGADTGAIADHVRRHAPLQEKEVADAAERQRRYAEEIAKRPPPAETGGVGSGWRGPEGVGAAEVGSAERRGPMGVGAGYRPTPDIGASAPRRVGAASDPPPDRPMYSSRYPMPTHPPPPAKLDKVDAAAYAPKKLRRDTTELLRVAVFQPKDRGRAARAAKMADAKTAAAGVSQHLGKVARGAVISAVVDARGAACEPSRIDAEWLGQPLDFSFAIDAEHDGDVAQALFTIRILADGAQVGAITFVRPLAAPKKQAKASKLETQEKLRRVERAFLSYSDKDRDTVALIANAYTRAGIPCFFDRVSLKSGEEWSKRLLKEVDRADLFHLCWSQSACNAKGVEMEVGHALTRRRKSWSKRPEITIQMLDGPPWAPHPKSLDMLNFDDFQRAAIVGYQRGVQERPAT